MKRPLWILVIMVAAALLAGHGWLYAQPADPSEVRFFADRIQYAKGRTIATGHVKAVYQGVTVTADRAEFDHKSGDISASGHAQFSSGEDVLQGDVLTYHSRSGRAEIWNAYGIARSVTADRGGSHGAVYFWGRQIEWDTEKIVIRDGSFTTCDIPPPDYHYHLDSRLITIYPQDKLIARHDSIYLKKTRLYTLPALVISLRSGDPRQREQSYIPRLGYTTVDGWYAKEGINYLWGRRDYGVLHFDWYEKTGLAAGIEHYYTLGNRGSGAFYVYRLKPRIAGAFRQDLTNRVNYRLSPGLSVNWEVQSNEYRLPGLIRPPSYSSHLQLTGSGARHGISASQNVYNQGTNTNAGYGLRHSYTLSPTLASFLQVDYSTNTSIFAQTYNLHTLGRLTNVGTVFDTELAMENTNGTTLYFINREPEVTMRTHPLTLGRVPYQASLAMGYFHEEPTKVQTQRADFQLVVPDKAYSLSKNNSFLVGAGFRQLMYGSGEAKYVLAARSGILSRHGPHLLSRFDYNYQQPYGFAPLQYDFVGTYELMTGRLEWDNQKYYKLDLSTGYDIRTHFFQNLVSRLTFRPKEAWEFALGSSVDLNHGRWQNIDSTVNLKISPQFTAQYWSLYDIPSGKMLYQDFALIRDEHDWQTRLVYRSAFQEVILQVVLKAFPSEPVTVGVNPQGAILPNPWIESRSVVPGAPSGAVPPAVSTGPSGPVPGQPIVPPGGGIPTY